MWPTYSTLKLWLLWSLCFEFLIRIYVIRVWTLTWSFLRAFVMIVCCFMTYRDSFNGNKKMCHFKTRLLNEVECMVACCCYWYRYYCNVIRKHIINVNWWLISWKLNTDYYITTEPKYGGAHQSYYSILTNHELCFIDHWLLQNVCSMHWNYIKKVTVLSVVDFDAWGQVWGSRVIIAVTCREGGGSPWSLDWVFGRRGGGDGGVHRSKCWISATPSRIGWWQGE